jgi:hypothetical protein
VDAFDAFKADIAHHYARRYRLHAAAAIGAFCGDRLPAIRVVTRNARRRAAFSSSDWPVSGSAEAQTRE